MYAIRSYYELIGVKPIGELLATAGGKTSYRFATKQAEKAKEILSAEHSKIIMGVTDSYIELEIDEEKVPEITTILATNGIGIFGVNKVEVSLEDAFINITGGGNEIE